MALDVGSRSHAKLEDASRVAMMALVTDDEGSVTEEAGATEAENDASDMEDAVAGTEDAGFPEDAGAEHQELEEHPPHVESVE